MKSNEFIVKVFGCSTIEGKELIASLKSIIPHYVELQFADLGIKGIHCCVEIITPEKFEYNTLHFQKYQKSADVLIFDGSIEEEDGFLLGDNYKCVPHAPYMNSNVIVVSRTVLPLNFIPHTTNVLPFGENFNVTDDKVEPIISYDNDSIVGFIKKQISIIISTQFKENHLQEESGSSVKKDPQLFLSSGEKIAFISYRSYYYKENKCAGYNVEDLKHHIEKFHNRKNPEETWKVIYYPPGGLSQDCPTEYLRWALWTYVYNVFIQVDEVWIFDTDCKDEKSYWDSWFTQGEFLSLMMIQQGLPECMPKIRRFNPHTGESSELHELPTIEQQQKSELSLLSANSDILWGDYAALRNVIMFLDEWKKYSCIKRFFWSAFTKSISSIAGLFLKGLPVTDFASMSKKHAYHPDFLTNRIFACTHCIEYGHTKDSFSDNKFICKFINIGDKQNPTPGYFILTESKFREVIKDGYVECPTCHKRINIKRNPSQDFYLWKKHTRNTNSENDWYIEKIPAYSVAE